MSYFFDEKGNIKSALLDEDARGWAESFVQSSGRGKELTSAQLRKFYNEFKALEKKVESKGFDSTLPLIKMVKSKAAYSANPNNRKIPSKFKEFLWKNIDAINEEKDFKAFILLFEAVVGFCYGIGMKNN